MGKERKMKRSYLMLKNRDTIKITEGYAKKLVAEYLSPEEKKKFEEINNFIRKNSHRVQSKKKEGSKLVFKALDMWFKDKDQSKENLLIT